ncbi:MAG: heterodisulfide reductase-related iron-sulfur binding cluster [Burkholderiales bacterium]|jgi:glycerol-3-phosphate dehydrogenase subunit C|nr:heterodisulfide reductase-related iron-sulfur binding cluster [Burkholderiales bacterium]MDP4909595.1 heterodisulfide reductase-related iron-sulfur binding cluster [Burkholderiaceae bacterium]MDP4969178.1 heterodisulfide reductase-related iron-sulfur binding cluster [Burkholderiaceae bacterium]
MSNREGSLEAPTRHPLDWTNPDFYDEEKLHTEMERVFDMCHGCRRCLSLCGSFPTLFDLVDATDDGEVHGVDKKDYDKVVDECFLCDVCYVTKCPYVPPHPWNLDFPHLMLRAKAVKFKSGEVKMRDKLLASTDTMGKFAGIPIVTEAVNAINRTGAMRSVMESTLGVDKKAWIPEYAPKTFTQLATASTAWPVKDGAKTPGKVAIYATCYINYNEPGIGQDLIKILEHNQIPYEVVVKEACCGMPKLELGDLESVAANKDKNIPKLAKLAREGYAIVTPIPSCTLMFKQELPLMFPDEEDVQLVKEAMWDPFEYFIERNRDGLLNTDFKEELGHVSYHIPCHSRVQNVGKKTAETLKLVPGTEVNVVERCSGHSGTWGVKKEFHDTAMKIGKPVFKAMANNTPKYISSDCQLAGHHIEQGMEENGLAKAEMAHPLTLIAKAYGL